MGFTGLDPKLKALIEKLAKEYKLDTETNNLKYFGGWGRDAKPEERIDKFCENLEKLTPGQYLFVEHPAHDNDEMKTVGHKGYENVGPNHNRFHDNCFCLFPDRIVECNHNHRNAEQIAGTDKGMVRVNDLS